MSAAHTMFKSTDAAMEVNQKATKAAISNKKSPFVCMFELGVDKEGYWNYSHMALQVEDLVDCLVVMYPHADFVLLFDQSSGHAKSLKMG
jgi:hypothetical protein